MGAPVGFSPPLSSSFLDFPSSCCQNVQLEVLFPLLFPLLPRAPSHLLLSTHQTPVVTPGSPVHHLKCIFMEMCEFLETSDRAALGVREHLHAMSTLSAGEAGRPQPGTDTLGLIGPGQLQRAQQPRPPQRQPAGCCQALSELGESGKHLRGSVACQATWGLKVAPWPCEAPSPVSIPGAVLTLQASECWLGWDEKRQFPQRCSQENYPPPRTGMVGEEVLGWPPGHWTWLWSECALCPVCLGQGGEASSRWGWIPPLFLHWRSPYQMFWLGTHLPGVLPESQKIKPHSLPAPRKIGLVGVCGKSY